MDNTIVNKPWGREIWWAHAKGLYMGKLLEINDGHKLSLQYHDTKDETIYVLSGMLSLFYSESRDGALKEMILKEGESFRVRPYTIHREETIKKVLAWKVCSMSLTMATLWIYTGSFTDSVALTFLLHGVFIFSHRMFEIFWEKKSQKSYWH